MEGSVSCPNEISRRLRVKLVGPWKTQEHVRLDGIGSMEELPKLIISAFHDTYHVNL